MEEILIVECVSSAILYIDEAVSRGYKVFAVNPKCDNEHLMGMKRTVQAKYEEKYTKDQFECAYSENDADDVVAKCQGHNIVCAVAGNEFGVPLIDDVAKKLGVKGNNPATNYSRRNKQGMTDALEKAGIRAIKSIIVHNKQDIVNFFKEVEIGFMKFDESASSIGNKILNNVDEALAHYEKMPHIENYYGFTNNTILLQEYIEGPEYVVNTVTCEGKHKLTDIWRYGKKRTETEDVIYHTSTLIESVTDEVKELVDYVFKVNDAVGVEYGPVHGEYKIDNKGPVLVETNCRPMGESTTRDYQLEIAGNCIADLSLDSYLNPEKFNQFPDEYHTKKSALKKYMILNEDLRGDMASGFFIAEHLKSYRTHNGYEPEGLKLYKKTKDYEDTAMILRLAGEDFDDVKRDLDLMIKLENEYPELLICPHPNIPASEQPTIEDITKRNTSGKCLVLTDKDFYEVSDKGYRPICSDSPKLFDNILYADCRPGLFVDKLKDIFAMFKYLKPGGGVWCCDRISKSFPYGKQCLEILKEVARI